MRRVAFLVCVAGAAPFLVACGGNVFTTSTSDAGIGGDGAGGAGGAAGGRGSGGRGTGGRSTGGRTGTGGASTGGFIGAGGVVGAGGVAATGGFIGAGGATCTLDCSYLDQPCYRGVCRGNVCFQDVMPDGQLCDDGNACTTGEVCQGGVCSPGTTVGCAQSANPCEISTCDPSTGACAVKPGNDGHVCDDGNACTTADVCSAGQCIGKSAPCAGGDGCCPSGCTPQNDSDCSSCTNIALNAVASSSGGGSGSLGPAAMNDGVGQESCQFHWVFNDTQPAGAYIELQWPDVVTIGSIYIETENTTGTPECSVAGVRNLGAGTVQYQMNSVWVDIASFSGFTNDVRVDFTTPVQTTALRVFDMTATAPGYNSVIYEWHVYPKAGCTPPP